MIFSIRDFQLVQEIADIVQKRGANSETFYLIMGDVRDELVRREESEERQ